jgi:hypothetical protein
MIEHNTNSHTGCTRQSEEYKLFHFTIRMELHKVTESSIKIKGGSFTTFRWWMYVNVLRNFSKDPKISSECLSVSNVGERSGAVMSNAFRHTPFVKGLGLPCPWNQLFNLNDLFNVQRGFDRNHSWEIGMENVWDTLTRIATHYAPVYREHCLSDHPVCIIHHIRYT